jgi:hypothetical protein
LGIQPPKPYTSAFHRGVHAQDYLLPAVDRFISVLEKISATKGFAAAGKWTNVSYPSQTL